MVSMVTIKWSESSRTPDPQAWLRVRSSVPVVSEEMIGLCSFPPSDLMCPVMATYHKNALFLVFYLFIQDSKVFVWRASRSLGYNAGKTCLDFG